MMSFLLAMIHPEVKVYFITNGGYSGNKDIYFSGVKNKERNIWGGAQSAGIEINTNYDEGSVYIHPDGKTMYFSSKGHDSMGGMTFLFQKLMNLDSGESLLIWVTP